MKAVIIVTLLVGLSVAQELDIATEDSQTATETESSEPKLGSVASDPNEDSPSVIEEGLSETETKIDSVDSDPKKDSPSVITEEVSSETEATIDSSAYEPNEDAPTVKALPKTETTIKSVEDSDPSDVSNESTDDDEFYHKYTVTSDEDSESLEIGFNLDEEIPYNEDINGFYDRLFNPKFRQFIKGNPQVPEAVLYL